MQRDKVNLFSYGVSFSLNILMTLISIPVILRNFGVLDWIDIALGQSIATFISIGITFNCNLLHKATIATSLAQ